MLSSRRKDKIKLPRMRQECLLALQSTMRLVNSPVVDENLTSFNLPSFIPVELTLSSAMSHRTVISTCWTCVGKSPLTIARAVASTSVGAVTALYRAVLHRATPSCTVQHNFNSRCIKSRCAKSTCNIIAVLQCPGSVPPLIRILDGNTHVSIYRPFRIRTDWSLYWDRIALDGHSASPNPPGHGLSLRTLSWVLGGRGRVAGCVGFGSRRQI